MRTLKHDGRKQRDGTQLQRRAVFGPAQRRDTLRNDKAAHSSVVPLSQAGKDTVRNAKSRKQVNQQSIEKTRGNRD